MFWITLVTDIIDLGLCAFLLYLGSRVFSSIRLSLQQRSVRLFMAAASFFALHEMLSLVPQQGEAIDILQEIVQTGFVGCLCAAMWFVVQSQQSEIVGLQQRADTDPLTGLENLTAFRTHALQAMATDWESSQGEPPSGSAPALPVPAVLMIDIDQFKSYNDTYGHEEGNSALQSVAQALRQTARQSDVVARYGGEEFVCLMILPAHAAELAAERVRSAIEGLCSPASNPSLHRQLTVSIGVAALSAPAVPSRALLDDLIRIADHELYRAKKAGRNKVRSSREPS